MYKNAKNNKYLHVFVYYTTQVAISHLKGIEMMADESYGQLCFKRSDNC